ncbi:MAG: hypothetical protein ACTSRP_27360, partial [Candidatus Helarchaeota archaeon]
NINSSTYNICIDGLPAGHSLKYYFIIYDKAGNSQKYPELGFYSITFTEESKGFTPEQFYNLIPYIILIAALGTAALAVMIKKRKKEEPKIPSKPYKPEKTTLEPQIQAPETGIPKEKGPSTTELSEQDIIQARIDNYIKEAMTALENDDLYTAYTNLVNAADLAIKINQIEFSEELLYKADEIKKQIDAQFLSN